MIKKSTCVLVCVIFCVSTVRTAFAAEPSKLASLGLSAATAMASKKDVVKGLKSAAADEYTDWFWDLVGGTEKFMTNNAEAEIPAAKDKIMTVVSTVQAIEKFAIAMTEGKYDDAAFVVLDETVGAIDHPLVSVTWEMCKLTYESHKLVQSTQAAFDIEMLYSTMSRDRQIMGSINPNSDTPPLISPNKETADYFFNKYVLTNDAVRKRLKSYVENEIGEEWPEQSWTDYAASWMTIGSGVDTGRNAEIEMLDTEWKNKGRTWIIHLIKDVNNQAAVAWGEVRVRQQMAEFKKFSASAAHFYNGDFDRMMEEFLAIRNNKKAEAEIKKMPAESQKAYVKISGDVNKLEGKDLKDVSSWSHSIQTWQLNCMVASVKMERVNKPLSDTLNAHRNKWVSLAETLNQKVSQMEGRVSDTVVAEVTVKPEWVQKGREQIVPKVNSRAQGMYTEIFKSLFSEFDSSSISGMVEIFDIDKKSTTVKVNGSPEILINMVIKQLNVGDFVGAGNIINFWQKDVGIEMGKHFQKIEKIVKEKLLIKPESLESAQKAYDAKLAGLEALKKSLAGPAAALQAKQKAATSRKEKEAIQEQLDALGAPLLAYYETLHAPARALQIEREAWDKTQKMPLEILSQMQVVSSVMFSDTLKTLSESVAPYRQLATAQKKNAEQYKNTCNSILGVLPDSGFIERKKNAIEATIKMASENAYTHMKKPQAGKGPAKAALMGSVISEMIPAKYPSGLSDSMLHEARSIKILMKSWAKAEKEFSNFSKLDQADIDQIHVLVDPKFDPDTCRNSIKDIINDIPMLASLPGRLNSAAKKAETDQLNYERDRDAVKGKANVIYTFFAELLKQGLIVSSGSQDGDYQIALPPTGRDGMVKIMEPYPHYATLAEITKIAQPVRNAWNNMSPSVKSFARSNASANVAKWEKIMSLANIPVARENNFLLQGADFPFYESDLKKAFAMASKLKTSSGNYDTTMKKIAELVPGLMQVDSKFDAEYHQKQAKIYNLSLDEYYKQMPSRASKNRYFLRKRVESILESEELQKFELGKLYIKIAKRVQELSLEHRGDAIRAKQEANRIEQEKEIALRLEEQKKKDEAASKKMLDDMGAYDLAGYYGFSIENARLNSRSTTSMQGDVILTKSDLIGGKINIEARMFTIDKAKAFLLSNDGGRTWKELSVSKNINFSFEPMPNKEYDFILRIKTTDSREVKIKLYNSIDRIIYQDVNFEQLVAETVKNIADAYEQTNLSSFSDHISRDYLGNKAILEEGVRFDFDMFTSIQLKIYINRISHRGNMFVAETKWDKKQTPRKTGQEQRTTGKTTLMFVLEDGKMKIKNLRGDLIYATLSPEIAQASGKSSSVVDSIRTARDDRNPTQPGATIVDDGGVTSSGSGGGSSVLTVQTASFSSSGASFKYIDFETGATGTGMSGDIFFEGNIFFASGGGADIDQRGSGGVAAFNALDTVPGDFADDNGHTGFTGVGDVYVILTNQGNYLKMYIVSSADVGGGLFNVVIKYAISTDGSTNLATQ